MISDTIILEALENSHDYHVFDHDTPLTQELIATIAGEVCVRVLGDIHALCLAGFDDVLRELLSDPLFLARLLAKLPAEKRAEVLVLHDQLTEQGR